MLLGKRHRIVIDGCEVAVVEESTVERKEKGGGDFNCGGWKANIRGREEEK